jgi:catecholate siderophore receptor
VAPEGAVNYEIGAKADLLDRKLQVSAALFRNERTNFRVPSNDPLLPTSLQELDGRARVDGIALSVSGNITPEWTIFANYTYLDSEVQQSISDFCLATPGFTPTPVPAPPNRPTTSACGNSVENPADPQAGQRLLQTPRHSGSLFTTYRFPFGLELGYGLTYQGRLALNNQVLYGTTLDLAEARFHGGTLAPQYYSDDYLTHRLFVSYTVTENLTAQLNVQNVTDELYYTGIRNNVNAATGAITGGWATPGEARSAVLSLFYSF